MYQPSNPGYEQQAKFIQSRITCVEKNFAELYGVFGDFTLRTAKLRDSGDRVASVLKNYAEYEKVNKSLSSCLSALSVTLSAIEEYRNIEVQRLENKVLGELAQYDTICKHAREEMKHTMSARERELSRRRTLDKARERQPFNRQNLSHAESELIRASSETSRNARSLSEQTEFYERKKLEQLKMLFIDFVKTEMVFHSKALELLTLAYHQIDDISVKGDLEDAGLTYKEEEPKNFRRKLKSPERSSHPGLMTRSHSLGSIITSNSATRKANKNRSISDVDDNSSEDSEEEESSSNTSSEKNYKKQLK